MPTRVALPQNYIFNSGTLFEDFETIGDWYLSGSGGRTVTTNTSEKLIGAQSLKLHCPISGAMQVTKTISQNFSGVRNIEINFYLHTDLSSFQKVVIRLSSAAHNPITLASDPYFYYDVATSSRQLGYPSAVGAVGTGWSRIVVTPANFTAVNGAVWTDTMLRLEIGIGGVAVYAADVSVDAMYVNSDRRPCVLVEFDDSYESVYTYAYAAMQAAGIPGTVYTISDGIGTTTHLTLAHAQEMYAGGWAFGNHTKTHPSTGVSPNNGLAALTLAQQLVEIGDCTDWLLDNGMPRAAYHLAYPVGGMNDNTRTAMNSLGILTGRTSHNYPVYTPLCNRYQVSGYIPDSATTVAMVKAQIDSAIYRGVALRLCFHDLVTGSPTGVQWNKDNFLLIIAYLAARRIKCLTIDEWYNGLTDPRYKSALLNRRAV